MLCPPLAALRRHGLRSFVCAVLSLAAAAQTNLDAGDVAVIGWRDTGGGAPAFTVAFLADVPPGTDVYFTNNGITGSVFRNTQNDGDGDEQLLRFSALAAEHAQVVFDHRSDPESALAIALSHTGLVPVARTPVLNTIVL